MAFAVNDRWPGFWGRHGLFLLLCPLARGPLSCATATRCRGVPEPKDRTVRRLFRTVFAANLWVTFSSPIALGGYRPWGCQVDEKGRPDWLNACRCLRNHGRRKARQPSLLNIQPPAPEGIRRWHCFR